MLQMGFSGTKDTLYHAKTDKNGLFRFLGLKGADLGIIPKKAGYDYSLRDQKPWTEDYKADPANPVVLTMWKIQGAEPMTHVDFDSWVPYDGTPISFDLFTGKKGSTENLQIILSRNPIQVRRGRDRFDWTLQIAVSGGGLVEAIDPYKNLAPENGYQPAFTFSIAKDDPNWTQQLTKWFYIHTAKGQYGRVWIDITTDSDRIEGTGMGINAYMNPSGSRNLEFDPKKEIKPPAQ
jgi:hypothetical protein